MATRNLTPEATEMLIGLLKGDTPIRRFQSGGMSEPLKPITMKVETMMRRGHQKHHLIGLENAIVI